MDFSHCRRCGSTLTTTDDHTFRCVNQHTIFKNATPTAGVYILTADNQVLLGRRAIDPYKGTLDCIGGFLDEKETFEQSLIREIREECGMEPGEYGEFHYLCSAPDNYEFGGEKLSVLSALFWTRLTTTRPLAASDDINELVICPIDLSTLEQIGALDIRAGFKVLMERKDEIIKT